MKKSIKILFLLCVLFIGIDFIKAEDCGVSFDKGVTANGQAGTAIARPSGCGTNRLCHTQSTSGNDTHNGRNVGLRITLVKCTKNNCTKVTQVGNKYINSIDIFYRSLDEISSGKVSNAFYGGYDKTHFANGGTLELKSANEYNKNIIVLTDDFSWSKDVNYEQPYNSYGNELNDALGQDLITLPKAQDTGSNYYANIGTQFNNNTSEKNNEFTNLILKKMNPNFSLNDLYDEIYKNYTEKGQIHVGQNQWSDYVKNHSNEDFYGYRLFIEPITQYKYIVHSTNTNASEVEASYMYLFILTPTETYYLQANSDYKFYSAGQGFNYFIQIANTLTLTSDDVGRSASNKDINSILGANSGLGLNIIAPYNEICDGKDCPNPDGDDPKPVDPPSDDPLTCIVDTSMFTSDFTDEDGNPLACYDNQIKYEDGLDSLGNKNDMCYETDTAMSSKYCTVKCSETLTSNFDTVMPVVEAGKYFTWNNNTLNGSRTCYTNINYNQFISDIRSANAAVSEAYYNNNSAKISSLDFNSDGKVDYDDFEIYQLYKSGENIVINGKTLSKEFDINKDGFYNYEVDTEYFLVVLNLDVNGDTTINNKDLTQLEQNINEFSGKNYDFDVDGDGTITQKDFSIVKVLSNNGGNIPAYIDDISLDYNKDDKLNYLDVVTTGTNKEYVKLRVLGLVPSNITTTMKNKSDINKDGIVNLTDVNIFSKFMSSNVYPNEIITEKDSEQWKEYYKGFSNSSDYKKAINYLNSLVEEMKKCYDNDVWNSNIYNVDDTTGIFSYSDNNSYSYSGEADVTVNYTDMIDENDCKDTTIQIYEEKNGGIGLKAVSLKKCTNIRRSKSASINFTINNDVYRYILKENQVSIHGKDLANEINKYSVENKGATLNYIDLGIGNFPVSFGAKTGIYGRNQANGGDLSLSFYNIGHMINNESKVENYLSGVAKDNINSTYSEYSCKFKVTTGLFTPPDGDQECDPNVDPSCDPNDNPDDGNPSSGGDDCTGNNCLGGIRVIYRPISLTDPFPDINAEGRNSGSNWCTESGCTKETSLSIKNYILNNRGVEDYEIYDIEPMYTFILTPTIIKEIREYNDNNSYASYSGTLSGQTYDFVCNKQGGTCISEYFTHLIDRTNATGTCVADKYRNSNDPSNFEVCRYIKD